ncbi:unnamed protein product [Hymenolepis diminuta]|nr:unnamed protein product [Hymenolepis diminuta]
MMHRDVELLKVQTALEESEDRCKRSQSRLDQARANVQRIEAQRATLEEQNKELREQLENEKAAKEIANRVLRRLEKSLQEVSAGEREVCARPWRPD